MTATAGGSHLTFFINNQQVGEVDNSQLRNGQVGVAVELSANQDIVVEFSNFEVRVP